MILNSNLVSLGNATARPPTHIATFTTTVVLIASVSLEVLMGLCGHEGNRYMCFAAGRLLRGAFQRKSSGRLPGGNDRALAVERGREGPGRTTCSGQTHR